MAERIESPVEGVGALQDFMLDRVASIPGDVRDKLRMWCKAGASPIVSCVDAAELIYARRDELPAELLEIGAQLAIVCAAYNFHGLGEEGRGAGMAATLRDMPAVASLAPGAPPAPPEPRADLLPAPAADDADGGAATVVEGQPQPSLPAPNGDGGTTEGGAT